VNPLELLYDGMVNFNINNLADQIFAIENKIVAINKETKDHFLLPEKLYQHSDILDIFNGQIKIAQALKILQTEFNEINEAINFLYLMLVTRLLVVINDFTQDEIIDDIPGVTVSSSETDEDTNGDEIVDEFGLGPDDEFEDDGMQEEPEEKEIEEQAPPPKDYDIQTDYIITKPRKKKADKVDLNKSKAKKKRPASKTKRAGAWKPETTPMVNTKRPSGATMSAKEIAMYMGTLQKEIDKAQNYYEAMSSTIEDGIEQLNEKFISKRKPLIDEMLPADLGEVFMQMASDLRGKLERIHSTLSDPENRIVYERVLFESEIKNANGPEEKSMLSKKMSTRGKWYMKYNAPLFAKECLDRAIELEPEKAEYEVERGWAVFRSQPENFEEPKVYLNKALQLNPQMDRAYYYLGIIAKRELSMITQHVKQKGILNKIFGG